MSRLTRYEPKEHSMFPYQLKDDEISTKLDSVHKLGKLEDLEDELGCPLDVVLKALKNGIWLSNDIYEFIHDLEIGDFGSDNISDCIFNYSEHDYVFLKDYKKTWWLSSDLEEKEND